MERLNLKPRNMRDLVTDEPFTRADLVTLQDPTNLGKFDMTSFHHLKNSLRVGEEGPCGVRGMSVYMCVGVSSVPRGRTGSEGTILLPEDAEPRDQSHIGAALSAGGVQGPQICMFLRTTLHYVLCVVLIGEEQRKGESHFQNSRE